MNYLNIEENNDENTKENYDFNTLPIYYINLDHDTYKKDLLELQLNNKNYHRISGVFGKLIHDTSIYKTKKNNFSNDKMTNSELGCLLSHIKVFKESLKKKEKYIIVMEDDADLISWMNDNVKTYLNKNISKYECIQLNTIEWKKDYYFQNYIKKYNISTKNP